ncbi:TPA: hypothetical protein I7138_20270 [Vibrio vulnificus]|nr:hypothetical protein [Vibrio vulnificus]
MNFMEKDLEQVFFSDFRDEAVVAGKEVTGKFSYQPREFDVMYGTFVQFDGPYHKLRGARKGDAVVRKSDGQRFVVHNFFRYNDLLRLELK